MGEAGNGCTGSVSLTEGRRRREEMRGKAQGHMGSSPRLRRYGYFTFAGRREFGEGRRVYVEKIIPSRPKTPAMPLKRVIGVAWGGFSGNRRAADFAARRISSGSPNALPLRSKTTVRRARIASRMAVWVLLRANT